MEGQLWKYKSSRPLIVKPTAGYQFTQKELQEFVGGLFEVTDLDDHYIDNCTQLGLPPGTIFVHHDDRKGLKLNRHIYIQYRLRLYGTVLICPGRSVARNAEADQIRQCAKDAAYGGVSERMIRTLCQIQVEEDLEKQQQQQKDTDELTSATQTQ